jgi:hypothetical protein
MKEGQPVTYWQNAKTGQVQLSPFKDHRTTCGELQLGLGVLIAISLFGLAYMPHRP